MSGVVEEAIREGEFSSSNPTGHEARNFTRKITRLATSTGGWLANGPSLGLNLFLIYFLQAVLRYPPVEKIISTGHQRRQFAKPPVQKGCEPPVVPLYTSAQHKVTKRLFFILNEI